MARTRTKNTKFTPIIKVISVGNDLYGDDGVGSAVLNALANITNLDNVELFDGATDALGLIDHFSGIDHAIIIDAAQMGEKPGTVKVFGKDEVRVMIKMDHLSVHGISLAETFEIAEAIDAMPKKLTIIGIEPESIAIDQGLSMAVKQSMPIVISNIISLTQLNNSQNGVKNA